MCGDFAVENSKFFVIIKCRVFYHQLHSHSEMSSLVVAAATLVRSTMNDNDVRILLARPPNGRTSGPSTGHMFHEEPASPAPAPTPNQWGRPK